MNKPISIHAPTRGATINSGEWRLYGKISIHAPTRGATPHRGGLEEAMRISIHAPTRGATTVQEWFYGTLVISIHAPTRGATKLALNCLIIPLNFNPRSHKGSDRLALEAMNDRVISIHAPTRGATAILHKIPYLFYFIFTNPFPISYFHTQPASDF